jgi:hypothetical protein
MTNSTRTQDASARAAKTESHAGFASLADPFTAAHRAQWEASLGSFLAWQQCLATLKKNLWEQSAVRHAGSPPIDT